MEVGWLQQPWVTRECWGKRCLCNGEVVTADVVRCGSGPSWSMFVDGLCVVPAGLVHLSAVFCLLSIPYSQKRNTSHTFTQAHARFQFSHSFVSNSLQRHGLQQAKPPCPSPTPRACSDSCPLSRWCHPIISSSVVPFSSCPQSGSFPGSQFFTSGGQSIGVSASVPVLPMNIQGWFPSGWTGWISLWSKGLSRVFSNTTVQKHQFFSTQLSL